MVKRIQVFYAYPGDPPSVAECIEQATDSLKTLPEIRRRNIRFHPWKSMAIGGKSLISTIAENIRRADIFACDLTHPNLNVTFELGYAIGTFKRLWISLNDSIEDAPESYKHIFSHLLGGLGYKRYTNHKMLADSFLADPPWASLDTTPLGEVYRGRAPMEEEPTLLYVKPPLDTNSAIATSEHLESSIFGNSLLVDDPKENPSPTLEWYAGKIRTADAVLIQMLSESEVNSFEHNLKASFVAGLAYGFTKRMLIIAPRPYDPPADYQKLLSTHDTAQQCVTSVRSWIADIQTDLPPRRTRRPSGKGRATDTTDIRKLSVGEPVAENEQNRLDDYFIETSAYHRALERSTSILVGRKGTGKTAILFALRDHLKLDKRNHVCVIKPVGYEIDGLVRVLNENIHRSERGYLIESLWKYLIYSELALSVAEGIKSLPVYSQLTDSEQKLVEYVNAKSDTISVPFSERLDLAVSPLIGIGQTEGAVPQRARISEKLHTGDMRDLRELLGHALNDVTKVAILIDNLDEPWSPGQDFDRLSELVLGLLKVIEDIRDEFQHQDHWRDRVNVSVMVLLRSDMFSLIQPEVAEQDKLPVERIYWDDSELLINLLNQRFQYASDINFDPQQIWAELMPPEVVGVTTRAFITRTVLPRPRDIIYLMRAAIDVAVNRGHTTVTEEDFLNARNRYSEFAFRSILAEDDPGRGQLEAVLFEFAGAPKTMKLSEIYSRISTAGVKTAGLEFYVNLLCDVNFLGIETVSGEFRYAHHEGERSMLREVARRLPAARGAGEETYQVNAAFHQVLQID